MLIIACFFLKMKYGSTRLCASGKNCQNFAMHALSEIFIIERKIMIIFDVGRVTV